MAIRCMNMILASKMYKSSKRKQKILAALADPVNMELVQQLDEYIGDEYKSLLKPKSSKANPDISDEPEIPEDMSDSGDRPTGGFGGSPIRPAGGKLSEKYGDQLDAEGEAKFEATNPDDDDWEDDSTSGTADSANSSVSATGKPIKADTVLNPVVDIQRSINQLAGELKGTLNARSNTAGVVRTSIKNDEIWIYYNDDTNLNNVMPAVIDLFNVAGYSYLLFNRLARTDNAMVFTMSINDTDSLVGDKSET